MSDSLCYIYDVNQQPKVERNKSYSYEQFIKKLMIHAHHPPECAAPIERRQYELQHNVKLQDGYQQEELKYPMDQHKAYYHDGFVQYLLVAWEHDLGIEIAPWYIWNVILKEFANDVERRAEVYRAMFTESNEQIQIRLYGDEFDIHSFIAQVRPLIPGNTFELLMPQFSPALLPQNYTECMYGLFGSLVQKYYNTIIMGCSIPKVRLLGTTQDWTTLKSALQGIQQALDQHQIPNPYIKQCQDAVAEYIQNLSNKDYWCKFFYIDRCGSGGEEGVFGHLMKIIPMHTMTTYDLRKMISRYPFKNQNDGTSCSFLSGIMYSHVDQNNILVPEYHYNITQMVDTVRVITPAERQQNEVIIEYLQLIAKYNIELIYAATEERFYDFELGKPVTRVLNLPQCIWYERDSVKRRYSSGKARDALFADKRCFDQAFIHSKAIAADVEFVVQHMSSIFQYIKSCGTGGFHNEFRALFHMFDISVLLAFIQEYIQDPFLTGQMNPKTYHTWASAEEMIVFVINEILKHEFLDPALQMHMIQQIVALDWVKEHQAGIATMFQDRQNSVICSRGVSCAAQLFGLKTELHYIDTSDPQPYTRPPPDATMEQINQLREESDARALANEEIHRLEWIHNNKIQLEQRMEEFLKHLQMHLFVLPTRIDAIGDPVNSHLRRFQLYLMAFRVLGIEQCIPTISAAFDKINVPLSSSLVAQLIRCS